MYITVNACSNNPCLNGGACQVNGASFTCSCLSGFSGNNCQTGFFSLLLRS